MVHELLRHHRSIRKYRPDPVPAQVLQRILESAARASSSGNMQPYSVIVTTDLGLRRRLLAAHFHQNMVVEAPVLLTFCSDFHRMRRWLELRQAPDNFDNFMSFMIGAIDAILAAQNAAVAAEAEGLGLCYLGTTLASCLEIAEILGCPSQVVPVVGFTLGYPGERPPLRNRLPLEGIVHRETYQDYDDAKVAEIYRAKEAEARGRLGVENLAGHYTRVKYTRESHLGYSRTVLDCLRRQGFLNHDA